MQKIETNRREDVKIYDLLECMISINATDLHLIQGNPPMFRIMGELVAYGGYRELSSSDTRKMVYEILNEKQRAKLEENKELDFSITIESVGRFRCNAYFERGGVALAVRKIPLRPPTLQELGLPPVFDYLTKRTRGLILVTGPTGSGKSTTLAAMIDRINSTRACHIITIEDPIEYLHTPKKSIISQRELDFDTKSFSAALKYALRQDPDVIMVGEMRDLETIQAALTAAETGHLVLATLHTDQTIEAINRIIDVFPPYQQRQVRIQLASTLEAVISQRLLPSIDQKRLVLALEVMVVNNAIRNLIREERTQEIYSVLQTSSKYNMWTMNSYLFKLYMEGKIDMRTALSASPRPDELEQMFEKRR